MTSERGDRTGPAPREAYVWVWLPEATAPVVAGRIFRAGDRYVFNYGQSYLGRTDAVALFEPDLPLRRGPIEPLAGLTMAGCLRDAAPDAWGRRVILNRLTGLPGDTVDTAVLDDLTYLLESGSDRIGALDFQVSPTDYRPRSGRGATLEELVTAAERVDRGIPLTPDLDEALLHGSSLGGARPKALIDDVDRRFIAKLATSADSYSVVKAEFVAMRLAERVGLQVAPVRLARAAGKDVLLVERFDRHRIGAGWARRAMVSALTLFGLDEMMARYAGYGDFAEIVRHRFAAPRRTLRELFGRMVFNVLCGNTDDHARNHAAFWDGATLSLTPAYDICPQNRIGREATQAMLIAGDDRSSRIATCLSAAPDFHLDAEAAEQVVVEQIRAMREAWPEVAEEADLSPADRALLAGRLFLNPYSMEGAPERIVREAGRLQ
jgi:serine/threonine-protein kinase HipA